jgi:branched-chain amino acid transport system ATP-binding protein
LSLDVQDLTVGYGNLEILHGVSVRFMEKGISCVIGPNGSGKSTLLKTIAGLLKPWSGRVVCDGEELTGLEPYGVLRKGISMVAQVRSIFPYLTVLENLQMGAYTVRVRSEIRDRMEEVYKRFPVLKERRQQAAYTLSGGEQRMLEIARALMVRPKILLLDEPSAMLSPKYLDIVYQKIQEIGDEGVTCAIVEQNVRKALSISDYVFVLNLGRNAFEGTGQSFLESNELVSLYLGTR